MNKTREAEALDAYSSLVNFAAERVGPAVVKIETKVAHARGKDRGQGQGSGVIFRRDGQILTNAHVVEGARAVRVVLADGRQFEAGVLGTDRAHDIAEIRIGARNLPVAELSERPLKVGQLVVAVGNPFGLGWTVTSGVVSALNRELPNPRGGKLTDLIQTDAPINPGSSGGPLVDSQGRIVGITTAIVPFAQGLGFAVPTSTALRILGKFIVPERSTSALSLGLGGTQTNIAEWIVTRNRLPNKEGVLVLEIKPDSPAAKASLKLNDVIVDVNGKAVRTPQDMAKELEQFKGGDTVSVGFLRDSTKRKVTVTLNDKQNVGT
ncbi:MAG: PDZ domain-containing protein [Chloroflexota bacterium]|nr:MAG: PDZ domain-containing protein [Chloroflexota bacterium]